MKAKRTIEIIVGIAIVAITMLCAVRVGAIGANTATASTTGHSGANPQAASTTVTATAGSYYSVYFTQSSTGWRECSTSCITGGNKDLDIYLLDSADFVKYQNSQSFTYDFFAKHARLTDFTIELAPDTYYLVMDNKFSAITDKSVSYSITDMGVVDPSTFTWGATFVFTAATQLYFATNTLSTYSASVSATIAADNFAIEIMDDTNYQQKLLAQPYNTIDSKTYQTAYTYTLPIGPATLYYYINYAASDALELNITTTFSLYSGPRAPVGIAGYDVFTLAIATFGAACLLGLMARKRLLH